MPDDILEPNHEKNDRNVRKSNGKIVKYEIFLYLGSGFLFRIRVISENFLGLSLRRFSGVSVTWALRTAY